MTEVKALNDVLSLHEYKFLGQFTSLPLFDKELDDDEWCDVIDKAQDLATMHVQNDDKLANPLYDIAWKISDT